MKPVQIGRRVSNFDEVSRAISELSFEVVNTLKNGLTFRDNFNAISFSITDSGAAGTANKINHGLGRAPVGYIVTNQSGAGSVYTSGGYLGNISGAVVFCSGDNLKLNGFIF